LGHSVIAIKIAIAVTIAISIEGIVSIIGDDISIKSANVKLNIKDVCNLISMSSEHFN
jgi:hypothetical protein